MRKTHRKRAIIDSIIKHNEYKNRMERATFTKKY
jgi:hypothetical protein